MSDITHVYVKDVLYSIGIIVDLYARFVVAFDVTDVADAAFVQRMFDDVFEKRGRPAFRKIP